ncbi:MAG TPA: fructose 1,6-bisphosphatase [Deltaproteobacteria bacterium]|nr:fructose 1,6-bisphosphatase [Deltaproteobacteria bacterium]
MAAETKTTLSVIKADVGGFVGHTNCHIELLDTAKARLENAKHKGEITDFHVLRCGDDIELIMTHRQGRASPVVHRLAWKTFRACAELAAELKLHGAGQDLVGGDFDGDIGELGPGVAEMEFVERESEPVVVFMADKTSAGAWNLPLYKVFADPFNTAGLVLDPVMMEGYSFRVLDVESGRSVTLRCPDELYRLLALIGTTSRFMVSEVLRNGDGEVAAAVSTQRLASLAGRYIGEDDPVMIVRCQDGMPSVGEAMEPFAFPHLVEGWLRSSFNGPLMPVPFYEANPLRFDGPPRVVAAGFQVSKGRLIGPHDMFDDPSFDLARRRAVRTAEYLRRHGPFQPHRLGAGGLRSSSVPSVVESLEERFEGP